jgi:hypothetical protein
LKRLEGEFRDQIARVFSCAVGTVTYVDTVQILTGIMDKPLIEEVLRGSGHHFVKTPKYAGEWVASYRVQQPERRLFEMLAGKLRHSLINRIDIARDYLCASAADASALHEFIRRHMSQPWHGQRRSRFVEGETYYLAAAWKGRNAAAYATRQSKVTGDFCAHVEARLFTSAQSRRYQADTPEGFLALSPDATFDREVRLSKINVSSLQKAVDRHVRATAAKWKAADIEIDGINQIRKRVLALMARSLAVDESGMTVEAMWQAPSQAWLEAFPKLVGRAVVHEPFPTMRA